MSGEAWHRMLELAEEYGWNPLGDFDAGWDAAGQPEAQQVMLEDALNLADALERALLEYEPEPVYKLERTSLYALPGLDVRSRPSLGALTALLDFSRLGAFTLKSS
jgi:hypothetical protein